MGPFCYTHIYFDFFEKKEEPSQQVATPSGNVLHHQHVCLSVTLQLRQLNTSNENVELGARSEKKKKARRIETKSPLNCGEAQDSKIKQRPSYDF